MIVSRRKTLGILAGLTTTGIAAAPRPAAAVPAVQDVLGSWMGLYQSNRPVGDRPGGGCIMLNLAEQRGVRFTGSVALGDVQPGPCFGVVTPSGRLNLLGRNAPRGGLLVLHGALASFGDGSARLDSDYLLPAVQDAGEALVLKLYPSGAARPVGGDYRGTLELGDGSVMPVSFTLTQELLAGGQIPGQELNGSALVGDTRLDLFGIIRRDSGETASDPTHFVALGPDGAQFWADGSFGIVNGLPAVQGMATIAMGDGSVRTGKLLLLPAVQRS